MGPAPGLRRIAQEIVTNRFSRFLMRLAVGEPLPPSVDMSEAEKFRESTIFRIGTLAGSLKTH
jgi:hypothetical protein